MGEIDFRKTGISLNAQYVYDKKAPVFIETPSTIAPDFPITIAENELSGKKSITFWYADKKNGMEKKIDAILSTEEYTALKKMYEFMANTRNYGEGTNWNEVRVKNIELTEKASAAVAAVLDRNPKIPDILRNSDTLFQASHAKEKARA